MLVRARFCARSGPLRGLRRCRSRSRTTVCAGLWSTWARPMTRLGQRPRTGRQKIAAEQGQGLLDLESLEPSPGRTGLAGATVETKRSALLWGVLHPPGTGRGLLMCSGV